MRAFEQIIWHIEVEQSQIRDGRLFIKFSGLTNHDQVRQLSIKVERSQGLLLSTWEDTTDSRRLGGGRPTADWISPGIAVTNLSLYRGQANLRVDISYERMLPDGSQQRFNMIEPYVIGNPSQL
ncbi:hypothetical protein [Nitrincola sp.]|uniref:hypothetical protein n=1 Tax=Nitrincola sp. TaxID=1926584 RepID=UPI003A8DECA0